MFPSRFAAVMTSSEEQPEEEQPEEEVEPEIEHVEPTEEEKAMVATVQLSTIQAAGATWVDMAEMADAWDQMTNVNCASLPSVDSPLFNKLFTNFSGMDVTDVKWPLPMA